MENIRKFEILMVLIIFGTLLYMVAQRYQEKHQTVKIQKYIGKNSEHLIARDRACDMITG